MSRTRPGLRSQSRAKARWVIRHRGRRRPVLVGQRPALLRVGSQVTDGDCVFEAVDQSVRQGQPWFLLVNMDVPEANGWFALSDIHPLGYVDRPRPSVRERWAKGLRDV